MRLSEYAVGRDNNFTLLRFSAAMTVLFAHSVAVLGLPPEREFFFNRLGFSLGEMGLDMLFVTSGFLVTASLVGRQDLIAYLWARILRVYPGMWVMLVLTVFVLAPALTSSAARTTITPRRSTWEYFRKCATLIGGVRYSLPGVFDTVPLKGEFNGSLVDDAGRSADVSLSRRDLGCARGLARRSRSRPCASSCRSRPAVLLAIVLERAA